MTRGWAINDRIFGRNILTFWSVHHTNLLFDIRSAVHKSYRPLLWYDSSPKKIILSSQKKIFWRSDGNQAVDGSHWLSLGVWTYTDLMVRFDFDYHVIDSVQFDIKMHHCELTMHCILNFQFSTIPPSTIVCSREKSCMTSEKLQYIILCYGLLLNRYRIFLVCIAMHRRNN